MNRVSEKGRWVASRMFLQHPTARDYLTCREGRGPLVCGLSSLICKMAVEKDLAQGAVYLQTEKYLSN